MTTTANAAVNLNLVLDQVAKDKGIERSVLIATLEDAMSTAAKPLPGARRRPTGIASCGRMTQSTGCGSSFQRPS